MSCNSRRPERVPCRCCGAQLKVGIRGLVPWRCSKCAWEHKLMRQRGETPPSRPADLLEEERYDERDMGPPRPLHGMTPGQYRRWRARRAVALYREGLAVSDIAERLGYQRDQVHDVLTRAGIRCRGDGREQLPLGPPAAG